MRRVNLPSVRLILQKFRILTVILASITIPLTGIFLNPTYAWNDDYPSKWRDITMDSVFDDWGMYNRECVSFAAWRLHSRNGFEMPFHDFAVNWKARAQALGYSVNSTPSIGAVAWFSSGHVAWVEAVSGSNVTIEEYNYDYYGHYNERTLPVSNVSNFIHFKDISSAPATVKITGQFDGSNTLLPGQILLAGHYIMSNNVRYVLTMQSDGNLVLYGDGPVALWSSRTSGLGGTGVVMQSDGNLVMYNSVGKAIWNSQTGGQGISQVNVQSDGNTVIYNSNSAAIWNTKTGGHIENTYYGKNKLETYERLKKGQYLRSADKKYVAVLQNDGNFVVYGPGYNVLWSSKTSSTMEESLIMQDDGNLVLYDQSGDPLWDSNTFDNGFSYVILQNDNNLVIYSLSDNMPTWSYRKGVI